MVRAEPSGGVRGRKGKARPGAARPLRAAAEQKGVLVAAPGAVRPLRAVQSRKGGKPVDEKFATKFMTPGEAKT